MCEEHLNINYSYKDNPDLPIQAAVFYGNDEAFDTIIRHKDFDPNKRCIHNTTALYDAVIGGKAKYVQDSYR